MTAHYTTITHESMTWLHRGGYLRHHLLILATWILLSYGRLGLAKMTYDRGSRTIDDLDDIFEILREKHAFGTADGSKWSDAVDAWIASIGEENLEGLVGDREQLSLTRESIWNLWQGLRTSTRELVIRKLYPLLISGHSDGGNWRLHCADAHKLCMGDTNCYWKYDNFISSCTEDDMYVLSGFEQKGASDNAVQHETKTLNYLRDSSRQVNTRFPSRRRQMGSVASGRKSVKRDVYAVEKRIRKEVRSPNKHRRKSRRKSIFWMGQHVKFHSQPKLDEILRYFSLSSRSNRCSSKCVSSLIMLNETVYGTLLAHCDCRARTMPPEHKNSESMESDDGRDDLENWEKTCVLNQQTAQSCRPRIFSGVPGVIGCTAARMKCEKDPTCRQAQEDFLSRCSQVINGLRCTPGCRESVERLRNVTDSYDTCVCDGSEGPTCRQIRNRVIELCDAKTNENNSQKKEYLTQDAVSWGDKKSGGTAEGLPRKNSSNIFYSTEKFRTHLKTDVKNSAVNIFAFSQSIVSILLTHFLHNLLNLVSALR